MLPKKLIKSTVPAAVVISVSELTHADRPAVDHPPHPDHNPAPTRITFELITSARSSTASLKDMRWLDGEGHRWAIFPNAFEARNG
jgi:hypothetical protein